MTIEDYRRVLADVAAEIDAVLHTVDAVGAAALEMQHVADHIKYAVGAPFRPAWANPANLAKELSSVHRGRLVALANGLREAGIAMDPSEPCPTKVDAT